MKYVELSLNLISGIMLGVEIVQDEGDTVLVVDLLVLRIMVVWGKV